jgi:hypothetical protein
MAYLTQINAKLCKILIISLVFEKNANFFAENWQKSQKIVTITSTPEIASASGTGDHRLASRQNVQFLGLCVYNAMLLFVT